MARLPQPGSDQGTWGQILNDYLAQTHKLDGTLKDNVVGTAQLQTNAVTSAAIQDGTITEANLTSAVQTKLNTVGSGGIADGTVSTVKLQDGAVTTVKLADSAVTDVKVSASAAIAQTKIANLSTDLAAKANVSDLSNYATTAAVTSGLAGKANVSHAHSIADVTSLQAALDSKAGVGSLASVATTGSYNDLINQPSIPAQFNPIAGTNVTLTGTYPNVTVSATPGAGVTDLSLIQTASSATIVSSTGADATIPAADGTNAGILTATDKTKLDSIATGATANSTDAQLRDRATHTGVQAISTVTGLQTALDGKQVAGSYAPVVHTHTASDISNASITGQGLITAADAAAARTVIGAGTSNLAIGTTAATAKAGDYVPTKADVGLGNVDNTSDANKSISSATQAALDSKAALSHSHTASQISDSTVVGRAVLTATDAATAQSALAIANTVQVVNSFAEVTTPVYGTLYVARA